MLLWIHLFRDLKSHEEVVSSSVRKCSSSVVRCVLPKNQEAVPRRGQEWKVTKDSVGTRQWWGSTVTWPQVGKESKGQQRAGRGQVRKSARSSPLSWTQQSSSLERWQRSPDHHPDFQELLQQLVFHKLAFLTVDENMEMAQLRLWVHQLVLLVGSELKKKKISYVLQMLNDLDTYIFFFSPKWVFSNVLFLAAFLYAEPLFTNDSLLLRSELAFQPALYTEN